MKTITVAELRQNPTAALDAVEHGETYVVTRHRREIGRLVPPIRQRRLTPEEFAAIVTETPLTGEWADELAHSRDRFAERPDAWRIEQ